MWPANLSGQRAAISPQASCQPWVTWPSISRGALFRSLAGLPAWLARCSARLSSMSTTASQPQRLDHRVVIRELGACLEDFAHLPVEALDGYLKPQLTCP
jgi:hypothetical protein